MGSFNSSSVDLREEDLISFCLFEKSEWIFFLRLNEVPIESSQSGPAFKLPHSAESANEKHPKMLWGLPIAFLFLSKGEKEKGRPNEIKFLEKKQNNAKLFQAK